MKVTVSFVASLLMIPFAHGADVDLYKKAETMFQTGTTPQLELLSSGWYSGRCYVRRDPNSEKAGALVLMTGKTPEGSDFIKQIIPASSVRDEADYFDHIDDEEYAIYSQELYADSNLPAFFQDGSLMSHLHYGILIGTMHTRAIGTDLIVAMTNFEETPTADSNAYFYCVISKKSREL